VGIGGEEQPTSARKVDPEALAARGINLEDVRTVARPGQCDFRKDTLKARDRPNTINPTIQWFLLKTTPPIW